eukprot:7677854-Pyramimonas_sp.AAC.1
MPGNSALRPAALDHPVGGADAGERPALHPPHTWWPRRRSKRWSSRQRGAKGQDRADGVYQP